MESSALTNGQLTKLHNTLIQIKESKENDAPSLDIMHIVESSLGYLAGRAAESLIGKTSMEEKVDYLIRLVLHLLNKETGKITTSRKSPGTKEGGIPMVIPMVKKIDDLHKSPLHECLLLFFLNRKFSKIYSDN